MGDTFVPTGLSMVCKVLCSRSRRLHDELTGTKPTAAVAAPHDKVDEEGDEDALDALFF